MSFRFAVALLAALALLSGIGWIGGAAVRAAPIDIEAHVTPSPSVSQGDYKISARIIMPSKPESGTDWKTLIPIVVALLAIAGAYLNGTLLDARKARASFVNDQIQKLYGPLYALTSASAAAWVRFRSQYRPGRVFFAPGELLTDAELRAWRAWMGEVFMPMNEKMIAAILDHADLIEGGKMPESFVQLIAHVEAYRVVIKAWQQQDFSEHTSLLNFPDQFETDVAKTFAMLKIKQTKLMETSWMKLR